MKAKIYLPIVLVIFFSFNFQLFGQLPSSSESPVYIQTSKDIFDYILFLIQLFSLIFLGIYVYKTWQIAVATQESTETSKRVLEEMKATREQEANPYVVTYFDVEFEEVNLPPTVYFTVVNTGKTEAKNVKLEFTPSLPILESYRPARNLNDLSIIKNGIPTMPPQFKIRTTFGFYVSLFEKCKSYKVKISYQGLNGKLISSEYILDLTTFSDLLGKTPKGMPQLVSEIENLNNSLKSMNKRFDYFVNKIDNGLWINNYFNSQKELDCREWKNRVHSTLIKYKLLWSALIGSDYDKLNDDIAFSTLKNAYSQIAFEIISLVSLAPIGVSQSIVNKLAKFSSSLLQIEEPKFVCNEEDLNKYGNEFINIADSILEEIYRSKTLQRKKRKRVLS